MFYWLVNALIFSARSFMLWSVRSGVKLLKIIT
jgi:hypothetical protein